MTTVPRPDPRLIFSEPALDDLDNLLAWSLETYGEEHFARYWRSTQTSLRQLAETPLMGRLRDEIGPGIRSFPLHPYVVYYRVAEHDVRILRIIHQRQHHGVVRDDDDGETS
jgi:toxin ParE1/3/4